MEVRCGDERGWRKEEETGGERFLFKKKAVAACSVKQRTFIPVKTVLIID